MSGCRSACTAVLWCSSGSLLWMLWVALGQLLEEQAHVLEKSHLRRVGDGPGLDWQSVNIGTPTFTTKLLRTVQGLSCLWD